MLLSLFKITHINIINFCYNNSLHFNQYTNTSTSKEDESLNEGRQRQVMLNDSSSHSHSLRWRIETNSGSGGSQQQQEIYSRLILDHLDPSANGLFECEVASLLATSQASQTSDHQSDQTNLGFNQRLSPHSALPGDRLKKYFGLFVNGK